MEEGPTIITCDYLLASYNPAIYDRRHISNITLTFRTVCILVVVAVLSMMACVTYGCMRQTLRASWFMSICVIWSSALSMCIPYTVVLWPYASCFV